MTTSRLKTFNPITPSLRGTVLVQTVTHKGPPFKSLTVGKSSTGGRGRDGRISVRHRGGGHKRKYRMINFTKTIFDESARVVRLEYDPNRTAVIALIKYDSGKHEYMIATDSMSPGQSVLCSSGADIISGNTIPLSNIPIGTSVHNVELKPGGGAQLARSAGCSVVLMGKECGNALLKMPSGEIRTVNATCLATIGVVSNALHRNVKIGKAGRNRWLGKRPTVRGVAMNPVDHPLGGGEGKTSGGRHPVSPWGQNAKGLKTRNNKRTDRFIISRKSNKK